MLAEQLPALRVLALFRNIHNLLALPTQEVFVQLVNRRVVESDHIKSEDLLHLLFLLNQSLLVKPLLLGQQLLLPFVFYLVVVHERRPLLELQLLKQFVCRQYVWRSVAGTRIVRLIVLVIQTLGLDEGRLIGVCFVEQLVHQLVLLLQVEVADQRRHLSHDLFFLLLLRRSLVSTGLILLALALAGDLDFLLFV